MIGKYFIKNILLYNGLIGLIVLSIMSFTGCLGSRYYRNRKRTVLKYIFGTFLILAFAFSFYLLWREGMIWDLISSLFFELLIGLAVMIY
jgi:hypothetical protein